MNYPLLGSSLLFSRIFPVTTIILLKFYLISSLPNRALAATFSNNETDKLALLAFKSQITIDPQGVFDSWNSSLNMCDWAGVTCGFRNKRVTGINLQGKELVGIILPNLGNLSFLKELNLGDNSFSGEIPLSLGQLYRLQNLNLSYNTFNGEIPPNLGQLYRLRSLNLSFNSLGGKIPCNLSQCLNLVNLLLDHNFLVGHIPNGLGSLSNLVMLYLKNNNLTGLFPASIGNLTSLQELYLSFNNLEGEVPNMSRNRNLRLLGLSVNSLSGVFPPSLYNLSSLELLSLSFNKFYGELRDDIGLVFPNLTLLYLGNNNFSGPIPVSLTNALSLERLDLPNNSFTGNVPDGFGNIPNLWWFNIRLNNLGSGAPYDFDFIASLTNCSQLQFLDISKNSFRGFFPSSITKLSTTITKLSISKNQIYGEIPEDISTLVNLNMLTMDRNFLTGKIPASIGKLKNLQKLQLDSNQLSGDIPSSLGNMPLLLSISLNNNSLEGTIPLTLGNCQMLNALDLSSNKLNGRITKEILGFSSLMVYFNVSYNLFLGPIPEEVGNLTYLTNLDISNNKFSGEIPDTLKNCMSLEKLILQGNFFSGQISSLTTLEKLQLLDLSHNNLSGRIPGYMANLSSLVYLDLSFNRLEGEVPVRGVFFNNSGGIELSNNANLCGGIKELHLSPCPVKSPEKPNKHTVNKLVMALIILASTLVLMIAVLSFYFAKKRKNKWENSASSGGGVHRKISYGEILNGTSRFSSRNLIGSGNFGNVYKGSLGQDETVIAIKVLNLQKRGASKSFLAECLALRNIRHRNLVKILTACSSIDYEGHDFKALVYQYMPNGSLEKWIHPEQGIREQKNLSIFQRLNIAINVASALDYLHNRCETPVVHCDLKPSNVLLDDDFTAHVSDFGLAQLLCRFSAEATMNQYSSLGIKGTIGYAAPEYGMGGKVSTEGDVYSYGVLLLELFTGRRPTDDTFQDSMNLHNFVKMALPNQVMDIVDQSALPQNVEVTNKGRLIVLDECLTSVFRIGVSCSSNVPQDRMNMELALMVLLSVRDKFFQAGRHEELDQNTGKRMSI